MFSPFDSALVVVAVAAAVLSLSSSVHAGAIPSDDNNVHNHVAQGILPDRWYHDDSHAAHALFKRQGASSSSGFPQVGSPTWAAAYPAWSPDSSQMPQAWKDALNNAVQAGKIPNLAPSVQNSPGSDPVYNGLDANSPQVCSGTYGCRIHGNIYDAPAGAVGIGFDDGPLPVSHSFLFLCAFNGVLIPIFNVFMQPSEHLYKFLHGKGIRATHFYIGVNIIAHPNEFLRAFQINQDDLAVHTWTHPYMTTLSNADVVAQLGWTLKLIYESTGGKLCRFWRPPYGDTDVRVNAIAEEVFGLTAILWNHEYALFALYCVICVSNPS
jgi:chitin deacetylase